MLRENAMGIQSKKRMERTPSIFRSRHLLSFFIPIPFFKLIDKVPNFVLDLACIPLDEQNPEGKEKPNKPENAQEDNHYNGDPKRKFFKDLLNIPFHFRSHLLEQSRCPLSLPSPH